MQDRHDLEKQLERLRERKWVDSRIKRLTRWPEKRRSILRELIAPSKDLLQPEDFEERIQKAQRYFEDLNDKERKALWDGLFPQLSSHLERAWQDAGERLFQSDYPCSPFRAPHRAESVARCRAWFFVAACDALNGFDQDVKWLAAWGPHLTSYLDSHVGGWILGAALRGGGTDAEAVRTVLIDSINGQHETGEMGYHAVVAMLNSDLQDDWEVIGKLLLAAQRQEGLREVILEAVDSANPAAFRYMLGIILENDLARFSAMVRAFDKWLGMQWAGGSVKVVNAGLRHLAEFFDDDAKREKAIRQGEPEDAYLALWVTAQQDAEQAFRLAAPLLDEPSPERRFVAIKTIERLRLFPECLEVVASRFVSERGDDPRMQMAMMAFFLGSPPD